MFGGVQYLKLPGLPSFQISLSFPPVQIGDTYVRDKGPEEFSELLQEAIKGTSVRVLPRVSPPPSSSINSSLGYSSLDASSGRSLVRKASENQVMDSITMKVSNLLSMKGSG